MELGVYAAKLEMLLAKGEEKLITYTYSTVQCLQVFSIDFFRHFNKVLSYLAWFLHTSSISFSKSCSTTFTLRNVKELLANCEEKICDSYCTKKMKSFLLKPSRILFNSLSQLCSPSLISSSFFSSCSSQD